jgi:hypothetical protein
MQLFRRIRPVDAEGRRAEPQTAGMVPGTGTNTPPQRFSHVPASAITHCLISTMTCHSLSGVATASYG